jgi:2-amino-4-hydroxy-6-hydroxymethyldihydropteridine diphosphokinase
MADIFLGLGSNLGDRASALRSAAAALAAHPAIRLRAVSTFRRTAPVGGPAQPDFVNAAARLESSLPPRTLLDLVLALERRHGRRRGARNGPRTLDLDLLIYGALRLREPGLELPHPRLAERAFVLEPLAELAPRLPLPGGGTAAQRADALRAALPVLNAEAACGAGACAACA